MNSVHGTARQQGATLKQAKAEVHMIEDVCSSDTPVATYLNPSTEDSSATQSRSGWFQSGHYNLLEQMSCVWNIEMTETVRLLNNFLQGKKQAKAVVH
jgi:hypothetical protein